MFWGLLELLRSNQLVILIIVYPLRIRPSGGFAEERFHPPRFTTRRISRTTITTITTAINTIRNSRTTRFRQTNSIKNITKYLSINKRITTTKWCTNTRKSKIYKEYITNTTTTKKSKSYSEKISTIKFNKNNPAKCLKSTKGSIKRSIKKTVWL